MKIVGIKEASGNKKDQEPYEIMFENIKIFTGDDKTSMGDIIDGFSGNISVTANVAPKMMHEMCHLQHQEIQQRHQN